MRITPYNQITSAVTIVASSTNVEYPTTNLLDNYGSQVFKFTGYADENIVFDAGNFNTIDFNSIGIVNHNITSGATITIQGNVVDSWGSPPYSETLTWRENEIYDFITATSGAYRYARLRIQDSGNTTPIKLGVIVLGDYIQLPGFQSDVNILIQNEGSSHITGSGQTDGSSRYTFKQAQVNMGDFSDTQRKTMETLISTNGSYQPGMAVIWESDFDKELPMYAVFEPAKNFIQNDNRRFNWNTSFTLRRVF